MISLLLMSILAQSDGAHVLTARSPGDGVSRWAVAAHYVQAGDIPLPGTAFITNPGLLAFAAGPSLTSTTSLLLADLSSQPTLSLRAGVSF